MKRNTFKMTYVNLTPHLVRFNNGLEIVPSGTIARVSSSYQEVSPGMYKVVFGDIIGLPDPIPDTLFIVSGMVASVTNRKDVVAPATGHPDAVRKDGQIYSVPGVIIK